jgi:hypothetical protein
MLMQGCRNLINVSIGQEKVLHIRPSPRAMLDIRLVRLLARDRDARVDIGLCKYWFKLGVLESGDGYVKMVAP